MRALVLKGLREVGVEERPEPRPAAGEVAVEVDACGVCGSDVHGFLGEEPRRAPGLCLGHESVGRLLEPAGDLAAGTRVVLNPLVPCGHCRACQAGRTQNCPDRRLLGLDQVQGALAERVVIAREHVVPIADHVSDALACLTEPLACAVHLLGQAAAPPFARTALFGCGTLGAMALVVAVRLGYQVTVFEPSAGRREMALALGAVAASDPTGEEPAAALPEAAELVIDCTGVTAARRQAVSVAAAGATVLLLGTTHAESSLDFRDVVRRELRLQASYGFTAADFGRAKALLEGGAVPLEPWLEVWPLERGQEVFERLVSPPETAVKLVVSPRL